MTFPVGATAAQIADCWGAVEVRGAHGVPIFRHGWRVMKADTCSHLHARGKHTDSACGGRFLQADAAQGYKAGRLVRPSKRDQLRGPRRNARLWNRGRSRPAVPPARKFGPEASHEAANHGRGQSPRNRPRRELPPWAVGSRLAHHTLAAEGEESLAWRRERRPLPRCSLGGRAAMAGITRVSATPSFPKPQDHCLCSPSLSFSAGIHGVVPRATGRGCCEQPGRGFTRLAPPGHTPRR